MADARAGSALGHVQRFEPVDHDPFTPLAHVAAEGVRSDTHLGHLATHDVVVPHEIQTPLVKRLLKMILGPQLARFTVGNPANARNPKTGLIQFDDGDGGGGTGDGGGGGNSEGGGGPDSSGAGGGSEGPGPTISPPQATPAPAAAPAAPPVPVLPPLVRTGFGTGGQWSAGGAAPNAPMPGGGLLPGAGTPSGQPLPGAVTSALSAASGNPLGVTVAPSVWQPVAQGLGLVVPQNSGLFGGQNT